CDVCSVKYKAGKAKHRWDGFIVCPNCYEQRHPQDFVKTRQDKISVPFSRPIPQEIFVVVPYNFYIDEQYFVDNYIIP
ncbi:MAG TPA: hypothetical protein PLT51_03285, partial [Candidatus Dojkabacteria bacterium]|nr:hypothetical protein [Candidatus Dojkabacteria bacterium]